MSVQRLAQAVLEASPGKALQTRLREAFVERLRGDSALMGVLGGDAMRVQRRPRVLPTVRPLVTFFEAGVDADPITPLLDQLWQVDVWDVDADQADLIAEHIKRLLHGNPLQVAGLAKGCFFRRVRQMDDVAGEGDLARVTQEYRLLVYDLRG